MLLVYVSNNKVGKRAQCPQNLDNLRRIVQTLNQRGVRIEFLQEGWTFTGEDSPVKTAASTSEIVISEISIGETGIILSRRIGLAALAALESLLAQLPVRTIPFTENLFLVWS